MRTHVLFGGHWYPCFGFLVTSPLGFKARVGCLIRIAEVNVMYVPQDPPLVLHLLTSWQPARSRSLPYMHVQKWDLAQIRTCNRTNRRRTRYHCASDPAYSLQKLCLIDIYRYVVNLPSNPVIIYQIKHREIEGKCLSSITFCLTSTQRYYFLHIPYI